MTDFLSKFASRKFLIAVAAIVLALFGGGEADVDTIEAGIAAGVAIAYLIAEAAIDRTAAARLRFVVEKGTQLGATLSSTEADGSPAAGAQATPVPRGDGT